MKWVYVCVCVGGSLHVYFLDNQGAGREVVQWVKALVPKPDPLGSISRIHLIEKTDSFMLFSDLGRHIVACVLP